VLGGTHRSQHWASRKPPAQAIPFTAAIVGLAMSMFRPNWGRNRAAHGQRGIGHLLQVAAGAERLVSGAGEHEHLGAGVVVEAPRPGEQAFRTAAFSALRACGRSIVSQATPLSTR